jgi:hypothetical protein
MKISNLLGVALSAMLCSKLRLILTVLGIIMGGGIGNRDDCHWASV